MVVKQLGQDKTFREARGVRPQTQIRSKIYEVIFSPIFGTHEGGLFLFLQKTFPVCQSIDDSFAGPGLAFIVYPEAVAQMPLAPLWSALFFFMLILLGLDSEFVGIEGVVTGVVDLFPQHLRRGHRKEMFTAFVCCVWFLIGLSMVTEGGMYVFQLFDAYSGSGSVLLLVVISECVAIGWFYGRHRFYDNFESMLGFRINPWIGWCWCFFAPIFCSFIFVFNLVTYSPLKFGDYVYPGWGQAIGWVLTVSSLLLIPGVMIHKLIKTTGTIKERLNKLLISELVEKDRDVNGLVSDPKKEATNENDALIASSV